MLTEIVKNAQEKQASVSLYIGWLGKNDEAHVTENAICKMDNDQKQQFAKLLLDAIMATRDNEADKRKKTEDELVALFGKEILKHEVVTQSRDGFFFSLTREGTQFRAWYALFGSVTRQHFDSCGTGCVFSASCENPEVLKDWLAPFVAHKVEWKSDSFGRVWIGHGGW